jgi:hypothetical protein
VNVKSASRRGDRGQVLPIFALFLIVLCGFAALAIDVSGALSARRFYRSAADGAALAGAQDLQIPGSRTVTSAERIRARQHAMGHLLTELGISGALPPACANAALAPPPPDKDVPDTCVLPGTNYHVSIKAGTATGPTAIACQACDPARSVQVGLRNSKYELSFARLFGQGSWSVGVNSVAGLAFAKSYTLVTLRPPKSSGSTFDVNDITLNGSGTIVKVHNGDVGSNANMTYSSGATGAIVDIDDGYGMFYFDPYFAPKWYPSPPFPPAQLVQQLPTLIADPGYTYPAMRGSLGSAPCSTGPANCAPTFDDARTSKYDTIPAVERADVDAACSAELAKVDPSRYTFIGSYATDHVYCFNPGIYQSGGGAKDAKITIGTGEVGLLKPGAYYLRSGLDVGGNGSRLLGGYWGLHSGVALMFDEAPGSGSCPQCAFKGNGADTLALNAGTKFPRGATGDAATPAIDWDNQPVKTSGPASPTPAILMSLLVKRDTDGTGGISACTVPTSGLLIEPSGCQDNNNKTISIGGGGQLDVEGVQYMPTDNIAIAGSSDGNGTVGQIVAWTVTWSGGTTINQEGAGSQGPGTLRLDAACTAPGTPCNP